MPEASIRLARMQMMNAMRAQSQSPHTIWIRISKGIAILAHMKSFACTAYPKRGGCKIALVVADPLLQISDLIILLTNLLSQHVDSMMLKFHVLAHILNLIAGFGLCRGALSEH